MLVYYCLPTRLSVFTPITVLSLSMWDFDENGNVCPKGSQGLPVASGLGTWRRKGDPDLLCGSCAAGGLQGHSRCCKSGKSGKQKPGTVRCGAARGMEPHRTGCGPD